MAIDIIAQELIDLRRGLDEFEVRYQRKRDEMYNALGSQQNTTYAFGGFKFQRTDRVTIISVNKQSFIEALQSENFPEDVRLRVIEKALVENEREGGLRISCA